MNKSAKFHAAYQAFGALVTMASELGLVEKSIESYGVNIRAAVRGLWSGVLDFFDFYTNMIIAIERGFTQAFADGLAEYGITLDEMSDAERIELRNQIETEKGYILPFADFIIANSKANGGKLKLSMNRARLWVEAYTRVYNIAKTLAGGDEKLKWTLHPAEHCSSCLRLDGKVKRASFWNSQGVTPKAWDKLNCRQGCRCSLEPTTDPVSRGPLPNLP